MKLLIQHTHKPGEIAGVVTYINAIDPGLNAKRVQTQIISTSTASILKWLQSILWADLVHMNSNHLGFAILCKLLGKKIIIKYHYLFYLSTHSYYEKLSFRQRLKREFIQTLPKANYPLKWKLHTIVKWARFAVRFATAIVVDRHTACSRFLAESLSFPWRVDTLYYPIKPTDAQKTIRDLTQPYTFAYVGRLSADKGVDLLLRAAHALKNQQYQFQVSIIGDGQNAAQLKALATALEINDRVHFQGSRSGEEIALLVRSSLALVVPSRWQEPAGYVALEASSVQTCSIVANVGGLPEMAGTANLFFERENVAELIEQMKICLNNPNDALDRGFRANQYIKKQFSLEKAVDEFMEICQELVPNQKFFEDK